MLGFLKKKKKITGSEVSFKIDGMHCTSCSMNIDGELEDLDGVLVATTSYPKSQTNITFNSELISEEALKQTIEALGYTVLKN